MSEARAVNPQRLVQELKVSGHLMTLDSGLFCIFNAPGSPAPDPQTGLPGVRISVPPGSGSRPEAIAISTFRDDGWLGYGNGAALVRVTNGPAHLLVTIYQAPNAATDAPKLQILRLQEMAAAAARAPAPVAAPAPQIAAAAEPAAPAGRQEIVAHVQGRGDVTAEIGGWMGEPGSKRWIEGFSITPMEHIGAGDIEYQAVLGRGWLSPWSEGGQFCGSRGMSLPILGLRARLRGEAAEHFDCIVEASFVDGTRVPPSDNGEPCQAESLAPLEAFRIELADRRAAAGSPPAAEAAPKSRRATAAKAAPPSPEKKASKGRR